MILAKVTGTRPQVEEQLARRNLAPLALVAGTDFYVMFWTVYIAETPKNLERVRAWYDEGKGTPATLEGVNRPGILFVYSKGRSMQP